MAITKRPRGRPKGTPQLLRRYQPPHKRWSDYHGSRLNMGDIVRHVLGEAEEVYRIRRMLNKPADSVELERIDGSRRRGFSVVPTECLMRDVGLNELAARGEL